MKVKYRSAASIPKRHLRDLKIHMAAPALFTLAGACVVLVAVKLWLLPGMDWVWVVAPLWVPSALGALMAAVMAISTWEVER